MFPNDNETVAPFISDSMEAIFPFLTSRFGKGIPADVTFTVKKVRDIYLWEANKTDVNNQTGKLHATLDIDASVSLRLSSKKNFSVGAAEFFDCNFTTYVNQTNITKIGIWLETLNCSEMYLNTNYGLGRYRSSPYVINTATWIVVDIINFGYSESKMTVDLNSFTGGLFAIDDAFINYYEGYIGIGMSANFSNSTYLKNQTHKNNLTESISKLVDILRVNPLENLFGTKGDAEWALPPVRS